MATRREKALQSAEKLVKKGRLEAAIEEFRKVLKESPDDTRTLNRVGDLYARLNRVDEAVELFAQAAERFTSEGFFVKAIAIYKKILRLDPTRMPVYQSLAELYQQQGLATEARAQYQVVADYYEKEGDSGAVLSVYERLVELDPGDLDLRTQLAEQLAEAERSEESHEQYRGIAVAQLEAGAEAEALALLSRAVELVPDNLQFVMQTVVELQADHPKVIAGFVAAAEAHNPEAAQARALLEQVAEPEPVEEAPAAEPEPVPAAELEQAPAAELEQAPAADLEQASAAEPEPGESAEPEAIEAPAAPAEPPAAEEAAAMDEAPAEAEVEAAEPAKPAPALETDEFEIELDAFEAMTEEEPAAEAPTESEPAELVAELELEPVEEAEPAPPGESVEPVEAVEDLAEILAEADALASYGLDEKAIDRLERAIHLEPGHLGAYRRLIGIQLNARRDEQVVRLAAEAASAALESGSAAVWRQIVGDLEARGFRLEGSQVVPPAPPAEDAPPAELLVDDAEVAAAEPLKTAVEPEMAESPAETAKASAIDTVEPEEKAAPAPASAEATSEDADAVFAGGDSDFFDLGAELEQELGSDEDLVSSSAQLESQSLEEIVEGFKQGMAEVLSPEAYDTHYNLGIAYREMGLIDEAIGEFQLAAKDPRYLVECCSLLGHCFQEKDFSDLALKWYRKGLESPAITEEETLGLMYEMGNLHLAVGDRDAARAAFTEIYGANSNFRDVVAKLEELR